MHDSLTHIHQNRGRLASSAELSDPVLRHGPSIIILTVTWTKPTQFSEEILLKIVLPGSFPL